MTPVSMRKVTVKAVLKPVLTRKLALFNKGWTKVKRKRKPLYKFYLYLGLGKLCLKIWQLCSRAVLTKKIYYAHETSYYTHENSYYARTTKMENPALLGVKTQKIVHFSFLQYNTLQK